jgi:hypothetical protein
MKLARRYFLVLIFFFSVNCLAQNGGQFFAGINYSQGPVSATEVQVADFNNDGKPDLVVAAGCENVYFCGETSSGILVYLGNGDGTFQYPDAAFGYGSSLRAISVGDFNGDGNLDVIAEYDGSPSGTVTIFLGDGTGNFAPSATYSLAGNVNLQTATVFAVGNFNADGKLDFAVSTDCSVASACTIGDSIVQVFLGNGDGTFTASNTCHQTGTVCDTGIYNATSPIVAADFNGDGKTDLVLSTGIGYNSYITLLLGNGDGTFQAPSIMGFTVRGGSYLAAGDFNSDGKMDLAIGSSFGVNIFFGNGDGTFQTPTAYSLPGGASISVADFNGDGKPDIAIGGASGAIGATNFAALLINDGTGAFQTSPTYDLGGWGNASVATGDFNGDGKTDIVLASFCSETAEFDDRCPDGTISVLLGNGDGTMQGATPVSLAETGIQTVTADLNGDGIPDLITVVQDGGVVFVSLGLGNGLYGAPVAYPSGLTDAFGLAVGDMNHDGKPDVVVSGIGVSVMLGGGDGTLESPSVYALSSYALGPPGIGDFAGKGNPGVAVVTQGGGTNGAATVGILLGNGDGTLQPEVVTQASEIVGYQLAVGDINHDGKADVVAIGEVTGFGNDTGITVFLSNGDGTLTVKPDPDGNPVSNYFYQCNAQNLCVFLSSYPTGGALGGFGPAAPSVTLADINGDGNLDLVFSSPCMVSGCSYAGFIDWYPGAGDGTFADYLDVGVQQEPDANYLGVAVADVNGDGKPDLIASTLSGVEVFLSPLTNGTFYASGTSYAALGVAQASIPMIADFSGTGSSDIAVANGGLIAFVYNRTGSGAVTTTSTIVSSGSPSEYGAAVTFTATVSSTSGTPSGTVEFEDGGAVLGTAPLNAGTTTFTTSALVAGVHSITALYEGEPGYRPSSGSLNQTVTQATTALTLGSSLNPSTYGQPVTFTAAITPRLGGQATGTISFKSGTTTLGTVTVSGNAASLTISTLKEGTHAITASYTGDSNFTGSTSNTVSQLVQSGTVIGTTVAVTSSVNPSVSGKSVTFTATVSPQSGGGIPTGEVTFENGATPLGTKSLSNGVAKYTTMALPAGSDSITAVYGGDENYSGSTSAPLAQFVIAATTITITSSPNPSIEGEAVVFTATVTSSIGAPPDGDTVTFEQGATVLGTGTLSGGIATFSDSALGVGTKSIKAVYGGDTDFAASTSKSVSQVITKATTTTGLTSSPNPSYFGQSVTLTATVIPQFGGTPTGTVEFYSGATKLGNGTLSGGVAVYTTTKLEVGTDSITAVYGGSSSFSGSTSNAVSQSVK